MELRAYLVILWRRKWVTVVMVVLTVIIAVVSTLVTTPIYTASTTLRILTVGGLGDWGSDVSRYAERLMSTYVEIATTTPVLEELNERLGTEVPPRRVQVAIVPDTELIEITVEDPNPVQAALAANTLAEILVFRSKELYGGSGRSAKDIINAQLTQTAQELEQIRREYENLVAQSSEDSDRIEALSRSVELKERTYNDLLEQYEEARISEAMIANILSIVQPAAIPSSLSRPRKELNIALGFVVGLVAGVGLSFLLENLDTTLYAPEEIEEVAELPVLGKIPTVKRKRHIALFDSGSPQAEAFRRLRTSILTLDQDVPLRTLLVTSAEPSEGKSTIVANLAFSIAQFGRSVVVVDSDLRRPTLHRIFDLPNEIGMTSILEQEVGLDDAIQDSKTPGIQVLTSGPLSPNPAQLIDSPRIAALIEQLTQQFDMVLLDTPSLLSVVDAAVLAQAVDGVMLVVGRAQARRQAVQAACRHLADVKARAIGVVMNRAKQDGGYYYYR